MLAILNKEINSFFSSPIGYLVIGIFLVVCGLFLFVFTGDYNILDNGFADVKPFFDLAPWIFIFGEEDGKKLALFNSAGYIELAIYKSNPSTVGSASTLFGLEHRDTITIKFDEK